MAGHSHWANIQRTKGVADTKRGKLFSKLSRYIMIAAKAGGGDPDSNLKLRYAIDKARANSMPKENIERAIKKGTGELEGVNFDEITYEGYGAGGAAVLVDIATDNRNRTNGEIKKIFEKGGGKIGTPGTVAWLFERKGMILIEADKTSEEKLMEVALEAGADDIKLEERHFEIICDPSVFSSVQAALSAANIPMASSELIQIAKTPMEADLETQQKVAKLMELLDDHDDVQNVYTNLKITPEATV
ncbi:MAG TPA: YebC/PmpR family DNA-binding transcriptional regulator [Gemmatales bacterium]|nr:YebC/PmpR family DNA-binding transcriptional regulator [Gemmatales bacterium]